jgi:hypothetical protein
MISRHFSPSKAEGRISRCQHEDALEMANLRLIAVRVTPYARR